MKKKGLHEGCIEQIQRLYADKLFNKSGIVPTDSEGRIRIDDWEMRDDVQSEVQQMFENSSTENIHHTGDLRTYTKDFKYLFGFGFKDVDYHKEQNELTEIEGLV